MTASRVSPNLKSPFALLTCALVLSLGLSARALAGEAPAPQRFVRDGVAVEFALAPADAAKPTPPMAGAASRVRFTITDTTTGKPLTRLHPAAWLSRRVAASGAQPHTCAQKVQELLGGSIFSKADLDLNSFQVLTLNDDATLTVVDPLFGFGGTKLLALIALPGVGADWTLTTDGKKIFVAVPTANKVAVVDTATWKISALLEAGDAPSRITVQPDGHYTWVATDTGITVIATDRTEVVARIALGRGSHEIVFSADSRWTFATNAADQTLSVIDIHSLKKTKDVPLGCAPAGAAYSQASQAVYLTDEAGGKIVVFDAVKHKIVARIAAEPGVAELKFAPGDRFGLVANPTHDLVLIFDAATNRIVQRAKIDHGPEQFTFTSDLAFVRRRGTASVGMIPLKEIGREGQAVPVAEFTGGEAPFGPRTSPADGMAPAPGESAVVVANAVDKTIYYYMEGMAAPMGNFSNYGRQPRAVLVIDRSLREVAPGTYETAADLPAAGDYDAVFFLDSPRITHCFAATIQPNAAHPTIHPSNTARLEPLSPPELKLVAGQPAHVAFRLRGVGGAGEPIAVPADLIVRTLLAPGIWNARFNPVFAADGTCAIEFTPPEPGLYYFYAESVSLGLAPSQAPCLILQATDAPPVAAP